ncbi:hypothetical protein ACVWW1_004096 [Bradyrhizobium sp. JR3.5]
MDDRPSDVQICGVQIGLRKKSAASRGGPARYTKPQSRPRAPIGGSGADHLRVSIRYDNETRP